MSERRCTSRRGTSTHTHTIDMVNWNLSIDNTCFWVQYSFQIEFYSISTTELFELNSFSLSLSVSESISIFGSTFAIHFLSALFEPCEIMWKFRISHLLHRFTHTFIIYQHRCKRPDISHFQCITRTICNLIIHIRWCQITTIYHTNRQRFILSIPTGEN